MMQKQTHEQIEQNTCFRLTFCPSLPVIAAEVSSLCLQKTFGKLGSLTIGIWWFFTTTIPSVKNVSLKSTEFKKKIPKTKLGVKKTQKTVQKHLHPPEN